MLQQFQPPLQTEERDQVSGCTVQLSLGGRGQGRTTCVHYKVPCAAASAESLPQDWSILSLAFPTDYSYRPQSLAQFNMSYRDVLFPITFSSFLPVVKSVSQVSTSRLPQASVISAWDLPVFFIFICLDGICRTGVNQVLTSAPSHQLYFVVVDVILPD